MWRTLTMACVVTLAACAQTSEPATTSSPAPATTRATRPTGPVSTPTTGPGPSGCPGTEGFAEGGNVGRVEQLQSDATTIGAIAWEAIQSCETLTVSFETSEGAPATTPPTVSVDYLGALPILRIRLAVDRTVIADQLVETGLINRLFVVRGLDGGMFIDLHLAAPTQAKLDIETSPGAIRLQLQPGLAPTSAAPAISDLIVVTSPQDGSPALPSTTITGYARTFEANVVVIATAAGEVVVQANTTAADWTDAWGEFRAQIELPASDLLLFVGSQSPRDGSLEGVTLSLVAP